MVEKPKAVARTHVQYGEDKYFATKDLATEYLQQEGYVVYMRGSPGQSIMKCIQHEGCYQLGVKGHKEGARMRLIDIGKSINMKAGPEGELVSAIHYYTTYFPLPL